jgi:hypothetical protein
MRLTLIATLAALVAACSSSTGPKGLDPTVLVVNHASPAPILLTWFDQSGQVATSSVAAGQTSCVHFTSTRLTDSVRFHLELGDSTATGLPWTVQDSPWFLPTSPGLTPAWGPGDGEFWSVTGSGANLSTNTYQLLTRPDSVPPC